MNLLIVLLYWFDRFADASALRAYVHPALCVERLKNRTISAARLVTSSFSSDPVKFVRVYFAFWQAPFLI